MAGEAAREAAAEPARVVEAPVTRARAEAAVASADVHPLLCAVASLTGDLSLLRPDLAPDQTQLITPTRGLQPEQVAEARRLAADALVLHAAAGRPDHRLAPDRTPAQLRLPRRRGRDREVGALLARGAGPRGRSPRPDLARRPVGAAGSVAPVSAVPSSAPAPPVSPRRTVCARPALRSPCSRRTPTSAAPGSRTCTRAAGSTCPTSSTASPSPRPTSGPRVSRPSPICSAYLQGVAKELRLGDVIRFSSRGDRGPLRRRGGGVAAPITPSGDPAAAETDTTPTPTPRPRPSTPSSAPSASSTAPRSPPSRAARTSPAPRSTRPPGTTHVDLAGKRVAVIGSGASAAQFVPCLVDEVAQLDVFQRTPPWLLPTDNYGDPFPPEFHDLLALLPEYGRWERLWQFWLLHEGLLGRGPGRPRVGPRDRGGQRQQRPRPRACCSTFCGRRSPDDELYEKMVPHFPPFAKRALRDDGRWAASFARDHVELVTTPIAAITRGRRAHGRRRRAPGRRRHLRHGLHRLGLRRPDARLRPPRPSSSTRSGAATPGPTSASRCPTSPTSSCSTAPTPTSSSTAASW